MKVEPEAAPAPELFMVRELVVLEVTVQVEPRVQVWPLTVVEEWARLALAIATPFHVALVIVPVLSTANSEVPPTWRSSSLEAVPEAVLVTLTKRAASTTPVVFHVGKICKAAMVCAEFSESLTVRGTAVEPVTVLTASSRSLVPVAAEVSPKVKAVWELVVCAQFQVIGLLPLAAVFELTAAVTLERAVAEVPAHDPHTGAAETDPVPV